MPDLLLAVAILLVLILLDLTAYRYGADTRFDFGRDPQDQWWK